MTVPSPAPLLKTFVMTRGRTGSTAILDELGSVAGCRSENEPFTRSTDPSLAEIFPPFDFWMWQNPQLAGMSSEAGCASAYLQILHGDAARQGATAVFWKALSQHFDERPYLQRLLGRQGYRAVYLKRRPARQVLSGMTAKLRNLYNTRETFSDERRYHIDLQEFHFLVRVEKAAVASDREFLKRHGFEFVEVDYEDYLADRPAFFSRIFDFVGLPVATPKPSNWQIMIDDPRSRIENFDEVAKVARELDDPF